MLQSDYYWNLTSDCQSFTFCYCVAPVAAAQVTSTLIAEVLDDRIALLAAKLSEYYERTESNLTEWNANTEAKLIDLGQRVLDVEMQGRFTTCGEKAHVKSQNLTAEEALERIHNERFDHALLYLHHSPWIISLV